VLTALARQTASPAKWGRWSAFSAALQANVQTDFSLWDALALAPAMLWVGPDGIDRQPITDGMARSFHTRAEAAVLAPQWNLINPLIDRMFR
jgi:hypothetical protein